MEYCAIVSQKNLQHSSSRDCFSPCGNDKHPNEKVLTKTSNELYKLAKTLNIQK